MIRLFPAFNLRLTPADTLRAVLGLRAVAVFAQLAVTFMAIRLFQPPLPVTGLLAGSGLLAASALGIAWRLSRNWPVTELEVALHLLTDLLILTWLLFLTGGPSNAFVSAYLVPIALAAIALRPRYGLAIAGFGIAAYSGLFRFHVPLPPVKQGFASAFSLHVFGMWVNFILSTLLIVGILWIVAANLRRRDRKIARAREDTLRNEHVVALGALAAGAAHELSTPLSTVELVASELATELKHLPEAQENLALLKEQIGQCKTSLSTLLENAGHPRIEAGRPITISDLVEQMLDRWRLLRPEIALEQRMTGQLEQLIQPQPGLAQALFNLLNNAADAGIAAERPGVDLHIAADHRQLQLEILDRGDGLDNHARNLAGRAAFSTKPDGAGLGLLLSHTTLNRWQGQLSMHNRNGGGTLTRIVLPLAPLRQGP